jgi:hypothetical protein
MGRQNSSISSTAASGVINRILLIYENWLDPGRFKALPAVPNGLTSIIVIGPRTNRHESIRDKT